MIFAFGGLAELAELILDDFDWLEVVGGERRRELLHHRKAHWGGKMKKKHK